RTSRSRGVWAVVLVILMAIAVWQFQEGSRVASRGMDVFERTPSVSGNAVAYCIRFYELGTNDFHECTERYIDRNLPG
ncbi:MAG TPA: hypothetical protein VIH55_07315, partial [Acidimicrobiia bacterium]